MSRSTGKKNLKDLHVEKQSTELPSSRLFETEIMECSTGREEQLQKHVPVDVWQRPLTAKVSFRSAQFGEDWTEGFRYLPRKNMPATADISR
jgi:hypothetical protein